MTPLKVLRREKRRGPRMYEMQGPHPVFLRRPADCSTALRLLNQPLVPATRPKRQFPGSSRVPGLPPDRFPSPAVTYFYCPGGGRRKGFRSPISRFLWLSTTCPQRWPACPPEQAFFHHPVHKPPAKLEGHRLAHGRCASDVWFRLRGDEREQPHAFVGHRLGVGVGERAERLDPQCGRPARARRVQRALEH